MCFYESLLVLKVSYMSLCVLMCPFWSLLVLMRVHWCLGVIIGPHESLWDFTGFFIVRFASLWILMRHYRFLYVFVRPCGF